MAESAHSDLFWERIREADEFFEKRGKVHTALERLTRLVFPDPGNARVEIDGLWVLTLEKLIELKLASGLSAAHRLKDLSDVQELIGKLGLLKEFGEKLDPSVRAEYRRLWETAQHAGDGPHERE